MARKPGGRRGQQTEAPATEETEEVQAAAPEPAPVKRKRGRPPLPRRASNGPTPERIAEALAEFTRLTTEGQRVNQKKSTLIKAFENEGGKGKLLKQLHALKKLDGDEAAAEIETLIRYATGAGIEIAVSWNEAGQGELADVVVEPPKNTKGTRDLAAAKAHADGYNSGKGGMLSHDNRFQFGTEEYVEWERGRSEGASDRLDSKPELAARVAESESADDSLPGEDDAAQDNVVPLPERERLPF